MGEAQGTAIATVQVDSDVVRVTRWDFPVKGANTGWHRHAYDYVVVPMMDGTLAIKGADGTVTQAPLKAGVSYARPAGVEHDVINDTDGPMAFVEIEVLRGG
ncbi:cupin domain-containing protein [Sulfitobacter sp. JB4-11]|uniref:cupin domain-containing protein n=1 Tax=Sulfitobacter rhodophyticola TaxID=3238304 RepID=UPI0035131139